jgi:citrate lyase subunit beta/citryl-CoA lyase
MQTTQGPSEVLFDMQPKLRPLPACDHYAGNAKFLEKVLPLRRQWGPLFDITLDLEDGAASGEEQKAAVWAQQSIESFEPDGRGLGVRIHSVDHAAFRSDLDILLAKPSPQLSYLMLPKVQTVEEVQHAAFEINRRCERNGENTSPALHVLIESPGALLDVEKIAGIAQVESLSFGIMDFVSHFKGAISDDAMRSPLQFQHPLLIQAKTSISLACHRFGKTPSHNVCTTYKNTESVTADALRARTDFGFLRMWSIHPTQIRPILQAFSPSESQTAKACSILMKAQTANWGPVEHEGVLHDRASLRYYWDVLARAEKLGVALPDAVRPWFSKN